MNIKKVVIVGGGASGIFAAIMIKKIDNSIDVTIVEQNDRIGKKILQTGNGKCNLSNKNMDASFYNNKEFIKKCLDKFSLKDEENFYNDLGLLTRCDDEGRIYPHTESATTVLNTLINEIKRLNVKVITSFNVNKIDTKNGFTIYSDDSKIECDYLIIATGSIAQAKTNGYNLLEKLGHKKTALKSSLVPLKTERNLASFSGIKVKCIGKILLDNKVIHEEKGEILFKEKGLSGILALNLSRFYQEGAVVKLDLIPEMDSFSLKAYLENSLKKYNLEESLKGILPKMIALDILKETKDLEKIVNRIKNMSFKINGLYDFNYAQVVRGGISTDEVDEYFASKIVKNLYIIGEVLDIDGMCGGYNLHFALMSAYILASNFD